MLPTRWAPPLVAALVLAALALPARADEKADALLKQVRQALGRLQTLQADLEVTGAGEKPLQGTLALKRPNLARIELKPPIEILIVSNGKDLYQYMKAGNQYQKSAVDVRGANIEFPYTMDLVQGFFQPETFGKSASGAGMKYAGKETVDGAEYEVLEAPAAQAGLPSVRYFISPADHLVRRVVLKVSLDPGHEIQLVATLKNLRAGAPVQSTAFNWRPPAAAKLVKPQTTADLEQKLIPVGKAAPDFNLPTPQGGRLSLGDALKGKKALLLNFWFYN
jgi:outer membrane lipoprotein-sorting protein